MKTIRLIYIAICCSLILNACESQIDFNQEISDPLLVLSSFAQADSTLYVRLSKSQFFLENESFRARQIKNGGVTLWVNDNKQEDLTEESPGVFVASYIPKSSDVLKLEASAHLLKPISCKTIIPKSPIILDADTAWEKRENTSKMLHLKIKLRDTKNEKNFYRITAFHNIKNSINSDLSPTNIVLPKLLRSPQDEDLFTLGSDEDEDQDHFSRANNVVFFNDDIFNGEDFLLDLSVPYVSQGVKTIFLFVEEISKDLYWFLKTRPENDDFADNPFTEPTRIHSNITGGVGLFSSSATTTVQVNF